MAHQLQNGHLRLEERYHIVALDGLDCPAHFAVTDTAIGRFLASISPYRALLCPPCLLASEAIKLAPFELNFLFSILVFEEFLQLGAEYKQWTVAAGHRLKASIHPAVQCLFIDVQNYRQLFDGVAHVFINTLWIYFGHWQAQKHWAWPSVGLRGRSEVKAGLLQTTSDCFWHGRCVVPVEDSLLLHPLFGAGLLIQFS